MQKVKKKMGRPAVRGGMVRVVSFSVSKELDAFMSTKKHKSEYLRKLLERDMKREEKAKRKIASG